ncbi:hypothetical protein INR49_006146 [Caranx melampygus]|nr:hypothetical protein INR49_006146 [Caranx melampygus]
MEQQQQQRQRQRQQRRRRRRRWQQRQEQRCGRSSAESNGDPTGALLLSPPVSSPSTSSPHPTPPHRSTSGRCIRFPPTQISVSIELPTSRHRPPHGVDAGAP